MRRYEKRREYAPTRMVQLAPYLVADSVESYRAATIDGDSVEAIFDPPELDQGLTFRQSIPPNLSALLKSWVVGFCPLNSIERSISDLIDAREPNRVERPAAVVTAEDAMAMLRPGTSSSTPREVGCWRARAFGECCRGRKLSRRAVDGSSLEQPTNFVCGDWAPKALELDLADGCCVDDVFDLRQCALAHQRLPHRRVRTEACREVHNRSDGAIVVATLETDPTQRRVPGRDADSQP